MTATLKILPQCCFDRPNLQLFLELNNNVVNFSYMSSDIPQ